MLNNCISNELSPRRFKYQHFERGKLDHGQGEKSWNVESNCGKSSNSPRMGGGRGSLGSPAQGQWPMEESKAQESYPALHYQQGALPSPHVGDGGGRTSIR